MEIQNSSTTSSKSNQLRNVNTVRWESGNVTTQPLDIRSFRVCRKRWYECHCQKLLYLNPRKRFLCLKCLIYLTEVLLDIYREYILTDKRKDTE